MGIFYGWIPRRSRNHPKPEPKFRPMKPMTLVLQNPRMEEYLAMKEKCPSVGDGIGNAVGRSLPRYEDPELAAREEAAREVKHTVAPICNKGGYQLITAEADLKTVGRKV